MYFLKSIIENVKSFKVNKSLFFYISYEEKLFNNGEYLFDCYGIESNKFGFFCYSDLNNVKTTIISIGKYLMQEFDFAISANTYNPTSAIIRNKNFNIEEKYGLYNFESHTFFWLKNLKAFGENVRINNQFYHRQGHHALKSLSLLTGEYEWEVDLGGRKFVLDGEEKEAKIRQIIGIWENQLIVSMSHGELLSINTQTGTITFETKGFGEKIIAALPTYKAVGYLSFNGPHLQDGKLYELVGSVYYCFNLSTQDTQILWQDDREERYVSAAMTTFTEDYIYFTGSYENRFQPHLIGVFNRKTLTLHWVHDMQLPVDEKMGYPPSLNQAPQEGGNKLYVLDSGGTLHIFEKQETA